MSAIPEEDQPNIVLAEQFANELGDVAQQYVDMGANPNTLFHGTILYFASGFGAWVRYNDESMKTILEAFAAHVCAEIMLKRKEALAEMEAEAEDGPEESNPVQ